MQIQSELFSRCCSRKNHLVSPFEGSPYCCNGSVGAGFNRVHAPEVPRRLLGRCCAFIMDSSVLTAVHVQQQIRLLDMTCSSGPYASMKEGPTRSECCITKVHLHLSPRHEPWHYY